MARCVVFERSTGLTENEPQTLQDSAPTIVKENEILLCEIGSTAHGTGVAAQDDLDLMGVFIEPAEYVIGLRRKEHWVASTSAEGERCGPGDVDVTYYSLRKFSRLALQGNPSIINLFFAPLMQATEIGRQLRDSAEWYVSKAAAPRYLGYMQSQKQRLMGLRGQKRVKRPELEEAYGFDTKYAYHIIRLALQGAELMRTGEIQMPMEDDLRTLLKGVRTGNFTMPEVLQMIEQGEADLKAAIAESPLPDEPDFDRVNRALVAWHCDHWKGTYGD